MQKSNLIASKYDSFDNEFDEMERDLEKNGDRDGYFSGPDSRHYPEESSVVSEIRYLIISELKRFRDELRDGDSSSPPQILSLKKEALRDSLGVLRVLGSWREPVSKKIE